MIVIILGVCIALWSFQSLYDSQYTLWHKRSAITPIVEIKKQEQRALLRRALSKQQGQTKLPVQCSSHYITLLLIFTHHYVLIIAFKYPTSHPPLHCTNTIPVIFCFCLSQTLPTLSAPQGPSRQWATPGQCFIHVCISSPGWAPATCLRVTLYYKCSSFLSCKLSSTHNFKRYVPNVSVIWAEGISYLSQVGEWKNPEREWFIWEYLVSQ